MQTLTPEMVAAARKSLQECLAKSVIPKEYWDEITHWLEATHMENIYLEGREGSVLGGRPKKFAKWAMPSILPRAAVCRAIGSRKGRTGIWHKHRLNTDWLPIGNV